MTNFKSVEIDSAVAINTPRLEYFRKQGVSAYMCLIPQTHEVAYEVQFVSDEDALSTASSRTSSMLGREPVVLFGANVLNLPPTCR